MASESIANSAFGLMGFCLRAYSGSSKGCRVSQIMPVLLSFVDLVVKKKQYSK